MANRINFLSSLASFSVFNWYPNNSNSNFSSIEKKDLASGKYKIVFEVKDGSNNNKSLELHIDNIATAPYITAPVGETTIVNTANGLNAALQTGSSIDKIEVLSEDTIIGGAGDDIIFGDSINTDHLSWDGRFEENHKDYMIKGQGINALDKYLSLSKSGYEDMTTLEKNMAKFDYIKEHHSDLNVEGDTRGGDDIISGGAGRDIIYGQGGDDTIITDLNTNNGKADGDILIDGGAGYDVIKLTLGQDIDFSELGTVIKNIEQIDLSEKGENKLLNLSLKDEIGRASCRERVSSPV